MRLSCGCPAATASPKLVSKLRALKLDPIVNHAVIRVVYEGKDHKLGGQVVGLFANELDHDITIDFNDEPKKNRKKR